MRCLYILEINPFSMASFANILFVYGFLSVPKLLILIRSHLFIFVFIFITLGGGSKKSCCNLHRSVLPMPTFSSKSFIVSTLTFRSVIRFLVYFDIMILGSALVSFFYMSLSSFPSTTYWRDCLFSLVFSCLLCCRLIDHQDICS